MLPNITATGNIGQDPELRTTQSGQQVCDISIACNKNKRQPDGSWETVETIWIRASFWGPEAEQAAAILKRGHQVTITGNLKIREYDRQDGTRGYSVEVEYPTISLPRIRDNQQQQQQAAPQQANPWASPANQPAQPSAAQQQQTQWATPQEAQEPPF